MPDPTVETVTIPSHTAIRVRELRQQLAGRTDQPALDALKSVEHLPAGLKVSVRQIVLDGPTPATLAAPPSPAPAAKAVTKKDSDSK